MGRPSKLATFARWYFACQSVGRRSIIETPPRFPANTDSFSMSGNSTPTALSKPQPQRCHVAYGRRNLLKGAGLTFALPCLESAQTLAAEEPSPTDPPQRRSVLYASGPTSDCTAPLFIPSKQAPTILCHLCWQTSHPIAKTLQSSRALTTRLRTGTKTGTTFFAARRSVMSASIKLPQNTLARTRVLIRSSCVPVTFHLNE